MELNFIYIFFIAFALAIDAFAVSVAAGSYFGKLNARQKFRLSFHFGLFQFVMPILGWLAGSEIVALIMDFDHWVAFAILSVIGGRMIYNGISISKESVNNDITKGWALISLSIATGIDALAVGFSMGLMRESIIIPSIIIGIVAATMSLVGIKFGEKLSVRFGKKVEIIGGVVLIIIGIKILFEHLWA